MPAASKIRIVFDASRRIRAPLTGYHLKTFIFGFCVIEAAQKYVVLGAARIQRFALNTILIFGCRRHPKINEAKPRIQREALNTKP